MKINNIQQNQLQQRALTPKRVGTAQQISANQQIGSTPQFTGLKIEEILPYRKAFKWMKDKNWQERR